MKKALAAALAFVLVGFMMVDGTLASTFNAARDIFQDLTAKLGATLGLAQTDGKFDVDLVNVGQVEQLYPGGQATTTVRVDNMGELDACFRLAFAVQETSTWDKLHFTFTPGAGFKDAGDWRKIDVGGTTYYMKVFTYTDTLAKKTSSPTVSITIAMDKDVTTAQINEYRADFLKTQVLAIDATPFLTATENKPAPYASEEEALNAALPLTNFNPFN